MAKKFVTTVLLVFVFASLGVMIFKEQKKCPDGNCGTCTTGCSKNAIPVLPISQPTSQPAEAKKAPIQVQKKLSTVIYYLHGNMRCRTCKLFEEYTNETIKTSFAEQLNNGTLELRIVNVDKPENEHFIKDFQLVTKSVVVTNQQDGKVVKWENLKDIWKLVGDKQKFTSYLKTNITSFVDQSK